MPFFVSDQQPPLSIAHCPGLNAALIPKPGKMKIPFRKNTLK
jgi:hypothetical protein